MTSRSIKIRRATTCDCDWLLVQLREFDRFFGSKKSLIPSDPEVALGFLVNLIMKQPVYVAEQEGHPIGFIAGALHANLYNPEIRQLTELFWWVEPDHRGSSAGARLLDMFLAFGRVQADWILMSLEAKSTIDPRSLTRKGFVPYESSYLCEVER